MAKSWADMSKEERDATGQTKKEYNRSTGQSTIPKYNPEPASTSSAQDLIDKYTPDAAAASSTSTSSSTSSSKAEAKPAEKTYTAPVTGASANELARKQAEKDAEAAKIEAKERASAYLRDHPNAGKGDIRDAGFDAILKEGGLNNHTYQQMIRADQKAAYDQKQIDRQKENEAYNQSRIDIQTAAPKSLVNNQSARDKHQGNLDKGKPMVTGPASQDDPIMIAKNEMAQQLYDTGYDYSYNEMIRHQNDGAEDKTMSGLYDSYGGYQNWYDNHSLYSGNFTGSNDIVSQDEAMNRQRERQTFIKDYQLGEDYQNKYGQYSWSQPRS